MESFFRTESGFTEVILLLKEARKPIVGHNMIYDICFTYEQFICQLPQSYVEFAKVWKRAFPLLFDTKCMALAGDKIFGKTELQHLYYKCQNDKRLSNNI